MIPSLLLKLIKMEKYLKKVKYHIINYNHFKYSIIFKYIYIFILIIILIIVSRISGKTEVHKLQIELDINIDIYPM